MGRKRKHEQTHCKWGHEFTKANTFIRVRVRTGALYRECYACRLECQRTYMTYKGRDRGNNRRAVTGWVRQLTRSDWYGKAYRRKKP